MKTYTFSCLLLRDGDDSWYRYTKDDLSEAEADAIRNTPHELLPTLIGNLARVDSALFIDPSLVLNPCQS